MEKSVTYSIQNCTRRLALLYEVGEKVIRPALVIVGEGQEKETEGDDSSGTGSASVWNEL
jgi:hypothetical protein